LLESSFGQFQADRAVVDLARRVRSQEEALAGYAESMRCHLGDFAEYSDLRRELSDLERGEGRKGSGSAARERHIADLRRRVRRHPCHACAERDQHARWSERWWRLNRETEKLRGQIRSRTGAVAVVFERIAQLLSELGYLEEVAAPGGESRWGATEAGRTLRRIYGERDLLVAECLRRGVWTGLDAPGLAAMASTLVFEPRNADYEPDARRLPKGRYRIALEQTDAIWSELTEREERRKLPATGPLAAGIALATARWTQGARLDDALRESHLAAGDFVRWSKQAIDLLDQVSRVADGELARTARHAIDGMRRGIVAYGGAL
jgi:ATP-dependent RNA helicase HelY